MRTVAFVCYLSALVAIAFMAATGERWPLAFTALMTGFGVLIGAAELMGKDRRP